MYGSIERKIGVRLVLLVGAWVSLFSFGCTREDAPSQGSLNSTLLEHPEWMVQSESVVEALSVENGLDQIGFRFHRLEKENQKSLLGIWRRMKLAEWSYRVLEKAEASQKIRNELLGAMESSSHPWTSAFSAVNQDYLHLQEMSREMVHFFYVGEMHRPVQDSIVRFQDQVDPFILASMGHFEDLQRVMSEFDFGIELPVEGHTFSETPEILAATREPAPDSPVGLTDTAMEMLALDSDQARSSAPQLPTELPQSDSEIEELLFVAFFRWAYTGDNEKGNYQENLQAAWNISSEPVRNRFVDRVEAMEGILYGQGLIIARELHLITGDSPWRLPAGLFRESLDLGDNELCISSIGYWLDSFSRIPSSLEERLLDTSEEDREAFSEEIRKANTTKCFVNSVAVDEMILKGRLPQVSDEFVVKCWDSPNAFDEWVLAVGVSLQYLMEEYQKSIK